MLGRPQRPDRIKWARSDVSLGTSTGRHRIIPMIYEPSVVQPIEAAIPLLLPKMGRLKLHAWHGQSPLHSART